MTNAPTTPPAADTTTTMAPRLGAYEIARRTKLFPRPFWATMNLEGKVLLEMADGLGGFNVWWVSQKALAEAIVNGDVSYMYEL